MSDSTEYDQLKDQIKTELITNLKYQQFLNQYDKSNIDSFIEHYSRNKAYYLLYGKSYYEENTEYENSLIELANDYLTIIQQKKLYDMQCLWRSEKIKIPGVELTMNFKVFENNINHCNFISPIEPFEVDILCDFILKFANFYDRPEYEDWQSYPYNPDDSLFINIGLSEWYDYYELRTENKGYRLLTDIREPKEEKYRKICMDEKLKNSNPENYTPTEFVSLDEMEEKFMKQFETPLLREQKDAFIKQNYSWYKEDLSWAIEILMKSDVDIPVKSNPSWIEATRDSATSVWRNWLVNAVQNAFEIRQNKISLGLDIAGEWNSDYDLILDDIRQTILEGRRIAGEPENFNF